MKPVLVKKLAAVKSALLHGDTAAALLGIEEAAALASQGIDAPARTALEPILAEIRDLAEASLLGARQAAEQVRDIVMAARSLQTYDSAGRRNVTPTTAPPPQRF